MRRSVALCRAWRVGRREAGRVKFGAAAVVVLVVGFWGVERRCDSVRRRWRARSFAEREEAEGKVLSGSVDEGFVAGRARVVEVGGFEDLGGC